MNCKKCGRPMGQKGYCAKCDAPVKQLQERPHINKALRISSIVTLIAMVISICFISAFGISGDMQEEYVEKFNLVFSATDSESEPALADGSHTSFELLTGGTDYLSALIEYSKLPGEYKQSFESAFEEAMGVSFFAYVFSYIFSAITLLGALALTVKTLISHFAGKEDSGWDIVWPSLFSMTYFILNCVIAEDAGLPLCLHAGFYITIIATFASPVLWMLSKRNYTTEVYSGGKKAKQSKNQNKAINQKTWYILGAVALCAVLVVGAILIFGGEDSSASNSSTGSVSGKYHVEIEIEDYGTIKVELDADAAPISVANFLSLAESGFYNGLKFHRIIEGFMMQGGDNGIPGSVEPIKGEFSSNGVDNPLKHTRGAISMARTNVKDSATSQFFIVHQDSPHLDGEYACFGYVTEGMEVVDAICEYSTSVVIDGNGTVPEEYQPIIEEVRVIH